MEYIKIDSRKITFLEYLRITRSPTVLIAWIAKLFHFPLQFGSPLPAFTTQKELEIPESEFPADARESLQRLIEQCLPLGFHSPRYFLYATLARETKTYIVSLLHTSKGFTIRLTYSLGLSGPKPIIKIASTILTKYEDGTYLVTTSQRAAFNNPKGVVVHREIDGTPEQVTNLHQGKLLEKTMHPIKQISTQEDLDEVSDEYELLCRAHGLKIGRYVPLTVEENQTAKSVLSETQDLKAAGVPNADILVQINQIQNKKTSWGNALLILAVSIIAFVGAGSKQWSWKYAVLLVPILLVHELGHYLAMKAFNYSNLRMFFIPFFGAAVSGRHYNVAGWKKVLVSLMGPVPGIVLGIILGVAGMVLHNAVLIKVGLTAVVLNGFNLLPIIPLDGGWIAQNLLFTRHHLLDSGYRVLAVVGLFVAGFALHSTVFYIIGGTSLIALPTAFKMARIVTKLRENHIPPASEDEQSIPPETAQIIINEVKAALPKIHTDKTVATHTIQIFETLNAKPPGWPATLGLLFVHAGSLGAAIFVGSILFVASNRELTNAFMAGINGVTIPQSAVECGHFIAWRGADFKSLASTNNETMVATFKTRREAESRFTDLTNRLSTTASLTLFGESVLLTLPNTHADENKKWTAALLTGSTNSIVQDTNANIMASITCSARSGDEATKIEKEINNYLSTFPRSSLIPPWLPVDQRSPAERAQHELARETYVKALSSRWTHEPSLKSKELQRKFQAAFKKNRKEEVQNVVKEMEKSRQEDQKQALLDLKAGNVGAVDEAILDLYLALMEAGTNVLTKAKLELDMTARMGQLPEQGPEAELQIYSSYYGTVTTASALVSISNVLFRRAEDGAPALVEWLCKQGCTDFKYIFYSSSAADEEQDKDE